MTTKAELQAAIRTAQKTAVQQLEFLATEAANEYLQLKASRVLVDMKLRGKGSKPRHGDSAQPDKA